MADEKKIIVDEDWKSRVEAEKSAAAKAPQSDTPPGAAAGAQRPADMPMPPASLELLLSSLATDALMALGQLPHPLTGQVEVHRHQAKYIIDTIDMLREKTKGNLTPGEERLFENLLHQLRMVFVETAGAPSSNSVKLEG
jgi:hypothetical protein